MSTTTAIEQMLWTPIPNMDGARALREAGYADLPIDTEHPRHNEPIVPLSEYGIDSQSYWGNPNTTGLIVPGANTATTVRRSVAEGLVVVQDILMKDETVRRYFGGPVRLMVRDGLRSTELQTIVHDKLYPKFLRDANPDWTEEEVLQERKRRIAKPSASSPHASGGAVDLALVSENGDPIHAGYDLAAKDGSVLPDFYETHHDPTGFGYRMNRRLLYWMMDLTGFTVNPVETWHYGKGDRLSAKVSGRSAYYDRVDGALDLL
ncbi:MAG TPA: M15 family metallopeptidase [Candidatus Saccharimonadales bacterium]|nr:M15 family metallopeptidase [Candidatus Saccharimonadales bacterium]